MRNLLLSTAAVLALAIAAPAFADDSVANISQIGGSNVSNQEQSGKNTANASMTGNSNSTDQRQTNANSSYGSTANTSLNGSNNVVYQYQGRNDGGSYYNSATANVAQGDRNTFNQQQDGNNNTVTSNVYGAGSDNHFTAFQNGGNFNTATQSVTNSSRNALNVTQTGGNNTATQNVR